VCPNPGPGNTRGLITRYWHRCAYGPEPPAGAHASGLDVLEAGDHQDPVAAAIVGPTFRLGFALMCVGAGSRWRGLGEVGWLALLSRCVTVLGGHGAQGGMDSLGRRLTDGRVAKRGELQTTNGTAAASLLLLSPKSERQSWLRARPGRLLLCRRRGSRITGCRFARPWTASRSLGWPEPSRPECRVFVNAEVSGGLEGVLGRPQTRRSGRLCPIPPNWVSASLPRFPAETG